MNRTTIHVAIDPPFTGMVDSALLKAAAAAALEQVAAVFPEGESREMTIVVTDDESIRTLNRDYLGIDEPTDVLSFPAEGPVEPHSLSLEAVMASGQQAEDGPEDLGMDTTADEEQLTQDESIEPEEEAATYLGDIVISYPRAREQAGQHHAVEAELQLLTVHGTLHLLGFDHATSGEKAQMWAAQWAALRSLGAPIIESLDA